MTVQELENRIIHADCMDIIHALPDKCVDLLLTDPPYGGGATKNAIEQMNAYGNGRFGGRFDKFFKVTRRGKWSQKYKDEEICNIEHWDIAPSDECFAELFRISKNQIIWGGNYFALPPTRCFNIWEKLTISEKFSMAMAEYCWTSFNANAKVWKYAPQDKTRFHPTQKPVALICRQLEEYSKEGDLILDPFSGSGTTAIACHRLNRRFICIERNEYYFEESLRRLAAERNQLSLFNDKENEK